MEGMTPTRARSRRRWARWFAALAGLLVVAYAGLIGYLLANERALIFRPPRTLALVAGSLRLEPESIELTTRGGVRTVAWRVRSLHPSPHWMLYLHGNAATIRSGGNVQRYHQLRSLGINVLAPDTPGSAASPANPARTACVNRRARLTITCGTTLRPRPGTSSSTAGRSAREGRWPSPATSKRRRSSWKAHFRRCCGAPRLPIRSCRSP